jgi:excisionase family DNA binding protein
MVRSPLRAILQMMDTQTEPLIVTVEQAADLMRLSRAKLYQLMESGRLDFIKIDSARRIPVEAIHEFIELHRTRARNG